MTLPSSSPWCHQMSPWFGDISEEPVAPLEVHWYSALQALAPLLTQLQRALGAASSEEQETWDPWEAVPPLRGPAPADKEPACVAWTMWYSPYFPGTSEAHLQPPEALWGDLQRDGPRQQEPWLGAAPLGQFSLQLSTWCLFAKSSYQIWILFGTEF